jgi:hypothetical protein
MNRSFRDAGHLVRPLLVLLAGLVVFLLIRQALVPKGFGRYGDYRPAALDLIRARPVAFAGQAQCVLCHTDEAQARAAGKHAHVSCEACHGPQAVHASGGDPVGTKPALPDVATLCIRCHEKDAAKPGNFPQVAASDHFAGARCNACHQPHNPHV